jgi:hypothetical protein
LATKYINEIQTWELSNTTELLLKYLKSDIVNIITQK